MCNACGFVCCAYDGFSGCGCDGCDEPECWSDEDDFDDESDGEEYFALPRARGFRCVTVEGGGAAEALKILRSREFIGALNEYFDALPAGSA